MMDCINKFLTMLKKSKDVRTWTMKRYKVDKMKSFDNETEDLAIKAGNITISILKKEIRWSINKERHSLRLDEELKFMGKIESDLHI